MNQSHINVEQSKVQLIHGKKHKSRTDFTVNLFPQILISVMRKKHKSGYIGYQSAQNINNNLLNRMFVRVNDVCSHILLALTYNTVFI